MKDVAEVMGVSVMTVSNAFSRPDQLSPDLRARILARAEKMGYGGPNASARSLRSGKTNAYGVVFSEGLTYAFNDPFSVLWLSGLASALERAGASVMLLAVPDGATDLEPIKRASVDGFAGLCASHPIMEVAAQRGLPVVTTDPVDPQGSWVAIDDHRAGSELAQHLLALGHRRLAILSYHTIPGMTEPQQQTVAEFVAGLDTQFGLGYYDTWARVRGVLEGLAGCEPLVVTAETNSRDAGRRAARLLLDRHDRPTAIACLSDVLALGVLDAMADRGIAPGREISVTGFDDLPEAARAGLTTMRQPIFDKGRLVGELLIDPDRPDRRIMLDHELVVRSSSGPVPPH